jgi:Cu(I)/Ag(I) efflux system membrane fusion protein
MNALKWSIVTFGVALLGAAAGYRWALRAAPDTGAMPDASTLVATEGGRKILYWHDPMKPEVKFDKPGKSPFMDMELVPVYADNGDATATSISVSANARQNLGIRVGHVEMASIAQRFRAVGAVTYDEHAVAVVQARVAGYVAHLHVRAALDRVRQGQVLVEITAPAWTEAEAEYLALLRTESPGSVSLRGPARQRLAVLGIPEAALRELDRTRTVPTSTALLAPVDGVVTELGLREGASFEAGAVLFRINGTATVWITTQVPETQAGLVAPGEMVETRATAIPGKVFAGRIATLLPQLDSATRTIGVRVVVDNKAGTLRPGMFVQTTFAVPVAAPQLWVPTEAVIATGERTVVISKGEGGAFSVIDVTVGTEANGSSAILSGLTDGQDVVLSGQFLIDSESNLKSTINRLSAAPSTDAEPKP